MGLKRREFLKTGAATATVAGAAGAGGLLGSACAGLLGKDLLEGGEIPLPDMEKYLRTVDDGLQQISDWNLGDEVGETDQDLSRDNAMAKKALRTLYLAGMFGDLPDQGQVHPGMQARIERALPEMEQTIEEACDYLGEISDEESRQIRDLLSEKSDPGMEFAQWIDGKEWSVGVSKKRRLQTRSMITHAVSRMRKQSPKTLFDDTVQKTRKLAARAGSVEEMQRQMIARMGEQAFWERHERLAAYAAAWEAQGVTAEDVPIPDVPPVELPDPVDADAGVEDEPAQVEAPTQSAPPAAPGSMEAACQQHQAELEELERLYREQKIESVEYVVKSKNLRSRIQACLTNLPAKKPVVLRKPQTCEELNDALRRVTTERQRGFITVEQYRDQSTDLRARLNKKGCKPKEPRTSSDRPGEAPSGAGWAAGIGGIMLLSGTVIAIAAGAAGGFEVAIAGAVVATIGLLVLIIAGIVAIVARAVNRRRKRRARKR